MCCPSSNKHHSFDIQPCPPPLCLDVDGYHNYNNCKEVHYVPQLPHIEAAVDCSRIACTRWFTSQQSGGCEKIARLEELSRTLCLCRSSIKRAGARFDNKENIWRICLRSGCLYPENLYHQILGLIAYRTRLHYRQGYHLCLPPLALVFITAIFWAVNKTPSILQVDRWYKCVFLILP